MISFASFLNFYATRKGTHPINWSHNKGFSYSQIPQFGVWINGILRRGYCGRGTVGDELFENKNTDIWKNKKQTKLFITKIILNVCTFKKITFDGYIDDLHKKCFRLTSSERSWMPNKKTAFVSSISSWVKLVVIMRVFNGAEQLNNNIQPKTLSSKLSLLEDGHHNYV